MRLFKTYLLIVLIGSLFSGCKKYPENKLWFKDPKKVFKGGKITAYTINGVDQMPKLRSLYKDFPYNYYGSKIDDIFEMPFSYNAGQDELETEYGKGSLIFSKTKREIEISFNPVNADKGAQNILVGRLSWKIMKLTKDGVLRLKSNYNFLTYEIQFN